MPSVGRWYSQLISPSANMFFARSDSFLLTPSRPPTASIVIEVSGTRCTRYSSTVPSSSGLVA